MSKGLEALKENRELVLFESVEKRAKYSDNSVIIEQELKDKEKLEKFVEIIKNHCHVLQKGVLPQYEQDLLNEVLL